MVTVGFNGVNGVFGLIDAKVTVVFFEKRKRSGFLSCCCY